MKWLRILLVEDDAVISALLAELLVEYGHNICGTAPTEMEAVAAAAQHAPDLMIVDAHLQAGSGVSAMATILRHSAMPHIFITGGARRIFPTDATVLLKPFSKASLMAALDSVTGHRQLGCRPACEMRLSRVGGRDDDIYLSELCRLPLPG